MTLFEGKAYYLRENRTGEASLACRFRYEIAEGKIHFYFDVKDDEIISPYAEDNEDIWRGDAVEIFLSPDGDTKRYKELEVSPKGVRFYGDIANGDRKTPRLEKREPVFRAEAERTEEGYRVRIELPTAALAGFDRKKMKLNAFCVDRRKSGEQLLYALNPTLSGSFHRPKYFLSEGVLE